MPSLCFSPQVPVVDANVGVGHRYDRPSPLDGPEELLAEMHRHGVQRAVVHHQIGQTLSAVTGNELLPQWTGSADGLIHQWMASEEPDSLRQLQDLHDSGAVSCVRLHDCAAAGMPFVDWLYGDLLSWLQQERLPLWISLANNWDRSWLTQVPATPVKEAMDTLRRFPDLMTVIVGLHTTQSAFVRPLLDNLPNTHIEVSRYEMLGVLEKDIADYGVERFVYGSFFPRYAMGPILLYVHQLGLDKRQLRTICAERTELLLVGDRR